MNAVRRRRKRSLMTRIRIFWIFIFCGIVTAGYAGYAIVTLPQLRVHRVSVRIDGAAVRESAVLAAAGIDRHSNAWLLDTRAIERRIEALPYVDVATVHRTPPADVAIAITQREPVACIHALGRSVTVDRGRRILQNGCAHHALPQIVVHAALSAAPGQLAQTPALAALLSDEQALAEAHLSVRWLGEDRFGQLIATDSRGVQLLFGSDADLARKAALVAPVRDSSLHDRELRVIDLRAPESPTVQFR